MNDPANRMVQKLWSGDEEPIPAGHSWADLASPQMEGVELEQHYCETLRVLGQQGGMLGLISTRTSPAPAAA